jgi:hypothetical protein
MHRCLLLILLCLLAYPVFAADPCPLLRMQKTAPDVATRIAAYACEENQAWFRPFIDIDGRPGGLRVYEAETSLLADGVQAWRRVATYWIDSGLLPLAYGRAGASECAYANAPNYAYPSCRAFIVDTPWSAAFVSWVMRRAGLPGFNASASHVSYVRDAYRNPQHSAYQVQNPHGGRPAPGDLLCYVRVNSRIYGFGDLATLLSMPGNDGLNMHCDIVVSATAGAAAYLVGGNVQQGVTLRMLRLTPGGQFADLPTRIPGVECTPDQPQYCNANRQDWAVMLKLHPAAELARLPPPFMLPPSPVLPGAQTPQCCVNCVVGSGVPRCKTP